MTTETADKGTAVRPDAGAGSSMAGRGLALLLMVAGGIGLAAAFSLAVEKFLLLRDPFYTPTCTINATFSCGTVMSSPASEAFGFPNPLLGIAGFAIVMASGGAMLAGAQLAGWFWAGLQVGVTAALAFVHWLMWQSLFSLDSLCPYCMVVWGVTITLFWYVTLRNLRTLVRSKGRLGRAADVAWRYHSSFLAAWLLGVAGLVVGQLWFQ